MTAIILAAGKGTRMYPLTRNCPKALLPINDNMTILDHLLNNILPIPEITRLIVVVNQNDYDYFKTWNKYRDVELYVSRIENNVIECLCNLLVELNAIDDLLIAAADNLLLFNLQYFINFFCEKKECVTTMYYIERDINKLQKTGVALVKNSYIVDMEEKPQNPKYIYAVPPFYIIPNSKFSSIPQFLDNGIKVDSLGTFLSWYVRIDSVRAYLMPNDRINLGDKESYLSYINRIKE